MSGHFQELPHRLACSIKVPINGSWVDMLQKPSSIDQNFGFVYDGGVVLGVLNFQPPFPLVLVPGGRQDFVIEFDVVEDTVRIGSTFVVVEDFLGSDVYP
jgi:hypothetical protein